MAWIIINILITATLVSFTSWLAGTRPQLAGFLLSIPLSTMIALAMSHNQHVDPAKTVTFAKSIFWAVPLSLLFFVPFLLAERLRWPFWGLYSGGLVLFAAGYFVHRHLV